MNAAGPLSPAPPSAAPLPRTGTASVAYVLSLIDVGQQAGLARERWLADAGLSGADLRDPLGRLPIPSLERLLEVAQRLSGDAYFGLRFGMAVRPSSFSGLGYVAMTCERLRDAIELTTRFGRLVLDHEYSQSRFEEDGRQARLIDAPLGGTPGAGVALTEAILAGWLAFGRWITCTRCAPAEVHLRHAERPGDRAAYEAFFECPARFGMPVHGLVFPRDYLELPVRDADPALHHTLLQEAQRQLDRSFAGLSLPHRVRALMLELLPSGQLTLEAVAQRLHLSPRALQRQLADAGCGFKPLLEQLRRERSLLLVRQGGLSLTEIALLLGYRESSSFSHAFRAWHGEAPQRLRAGVGAQTPGVAEQAAAGL
ncbi:AraC family transcriptional regulator [Pelomonas sp. CA6]|uniref:AraC family transcriptional regulator n=1 Tax=Pelomonas sp. CA6 TaxID=2907999 RepID=UPI001F4C3C97|nr:AraC family transcriptional regulator [Pelomonas sp. CA6]MCH7344217.1 AraC family transcriptional regulator [Pelomonas sp. CA6]